MPSFYWSIVSLLVLVLAGVTKPTTVECAKGFYIESRRDKGAGRYECRQVVPASKHEPRGHEPDEMIIGYDGAIQGEIWCHDGKIPIVVGDRLIRCEIPLAVVPLE